MHVTKVASQREFKLHMLHSYVQRFLNLFYIERSMQSKELPPVVVKVRYSFILMSKEEA